MANVARSRGYAINYEDSGEGSPLVLIPGFLQSASDWRRSGYIDRLSKQWRVVAMDPLGQGRSEKPEDPTLYRSPGITAEVIAVLDAAGIEKAPLWGYSRGAWLAAMTTIEHPQRVSALVLGGASLTDPPPTELPLWVEPISRGDWEAFWELFPIPLDATTKAHFQKVNNPKTLAAERIGRVESAYAFDLSRVKAPACVYCGAEDGPEEADATAEALHTKVRVVPGDHAGAFNEADEVIAVVAPFLQSVTLSHPGRGSG